MKKIALVFLLIHGFLASPAQTFLVTDTTGRALEGAAVFIKDAAGKKFLAVSGKNGKAVATTKIEEPVSAEISMLGFHTAIIPLHAGESFYRITLTSKSYRLDEVIVTGQAAPVTVNETMQDATVISREKIELLAAGALENIMQYELSTALSRDPVLGSNLSLRGLSGNNIKYLIDGVPVTGRMNGFVDLSQLNIDNARQVEIINGPMTVNYGSDAHGGVINIITDGKMESHACAWALAETAGRYHTAAIAGYVNGNSAFEMHASREFFEGWNDEPQTRWKAFKPKTQYHAGAKVHHRLRRWNFSATSDYMHEKLSNKGEPVITPYYAYALDEYYFTNRWMNRISADCMMNNDSRIKSMFSCSLFKRIKNRYRKDMVALQESLTDLAEQDTSGFNTLHFRTDYHFKTASGKISMLTGTELNHETADGKRTGGKQSEYQAAVYATAEWQTLDKLRIMPGLRFNYFSNETFRLIPALSIRFDLTEQLFFRGNYSMGFRQPSPKEKFLDFQDVNHNISGNENLKPEISHNFTLSLQAEQQAGTFLISATPQFYYTTITNMITLAQVNNNDLLYSYINIGKYQTQGASFSLNAGHSKVAVGAGFSVNGVKDDVNNKMHYSPAANGNVLFKDEKNGLTAGLFIRWSGKSYVYTTGNTGLTSVRQEAFTMAEISVSKSFFKKRFEIQTGIKNLFDVKRVSATGTEGIHAAGNMPAGTGRSCFLKLTLSTGK